MAAVRSRAIPGATDGDIITRQRADAIRAAQEQQAAIMEKLRRHKLEFPKYDFLELIGKGAYGRVFKACDLTHKRVVAVKVIDVDTEDHKGPITHKDSTINATSHEIKVLQQLQDAKAKNINPFFSAFPMHSQFWIVTDYCPGGSVATLKRSTGGKLEEKYIIPIARELAIGLKAIHEAGIIHRDIKAANVMIHERGLLQIIDFGVAGILESSNNKRSTIIGTPHWMPPEMNKLTPSQGLSYGTEIDVWAYGCTLYEIATGQPPFHRTTGRLLGISQLREPPRLKRTDHSDGLCDLVADVLQTSPANRPSMETVLLDKYIESTLESHPTTSLVDLVNKYYQWEQSGGQRISLFNPGGAQAAVFPEDLDGGANEWIFSTTVNFDRQFAEQYQEDITVTETAGSPPSIITAFDQEPPRDSFDSYLVEPDLYTPLTSPGFSSTVAESYTENKVATTRPVVQDDPRLEGRIQRGGKALHNLFDREADPYKYNPVKAETTGHYEAHHRPAAGRAKSDLPLRDATQSSSQSRKELEVFDTNKARGSFPNIDLANVNTIKANRMNRAAGDTGSNDEDENDNYGGFKEPKRATMAWTFGTAETAEDVQGKAKRATKDWSFPGNMDTDDSDTDNTPVFREPKRNTRAFVFPQMQPADDVPPEIPRRPALLHATTAPVGEPLRSESGVIDLDALMMTSTAAPEEQDLMRAAFNDHEPTPTAQDTPVSTEPTITPFDFPSRTRLSTGAPYSASSTDDEREDAPFSNPLEWSSLTDEELKAGIDEELTAQGILDPMIRGIRRRELFKQRKEAQAWLKQDLKKVSIDEWKAQGSQTFSLADLEDFPSKDHALWAKYDPQVNPAPGWPRDYKFGQQNPIPGLANILRSTDGAADDDTTQTISPGTRPPTARDLDAELRGLGYPDPIPPRAAAMAQDAPEEVLETELARLLRDWTRSLEVGRGVIRRVREQLEAEEDGPRENAGETEGRNGGALKYDEGSDAGGESE